MGLCVQRAIVSCNQPADALCTILSITDNLLGFQLCVVQPTILSYVRPDFRLSGDASEILSPRLLTPTSSSDSFKTV